MTAPLPIEALTRLLSEKPDLLAALQAAGGADAAAGILAAAAAEQGIAVDRDTLAAHLAKRDIAGALSDEELDRVSGGFFDLFFRIGRSTGGGRRLDDAVDPNLRAPGGRNGTDGVEIVPV